MRIPVYSVVAYSGMGKTSFLENLIPELKKRGLRVAAVKHDAREFEIDYKGKDSWRLTNAGADITCITSATHSAIMENRPVDIEQILTGLHNVDIVIVEGYKERNYKKIGLYRSEAQLPLTSIQGEYLAIVTDIPLDLDVPQFALDDYSGVAEFLINDMEDNSLQKGLFGSIQLKMGRKQSGESEAVFGKGLIQLLEGIDRHGSINMATKEMRMAYSKAWKVINNAENRCGLTLVSRNGPGGSTLTKAGKEIVRLYGELSLQAQMAVDDWLSGDFKDQ